ncbi:related to Autophagy protein 16 [Rhynchosporium secalis]|uniref:Related to Autophagy protein 16 n=1 Tax=Rhynchosporium secalis TaxID=38038 RepID=A0A1E1MSE8_RHYSE|nr:related to Autophagy protein 16 [Rhynchosporium secalis]
MTSWRDDYIQALQDRNQREQASYQKLDVDLIAAFTDLLDRTASLEAEKASNLYSDPKSSDIKARDTPQVQAPGTNDGTGHLRRDLAESLRSNRQLQTRIKSAEMELVKLRMKSKVETRQIDELSRERAYLAQKLKDRDEELKGKTKLLDDVHDEVISLNLQLNMSEQKVKDLKAENKELIDRWMARKGREAEEMNKAFEER